MPAYPGYAIPGNVGGPLDSTSLDYFDQNPKAAYEDWSAMLGATGEDPYARFLRGRYDTYKGQYDASLARDPIGRAQNNDPMLYFRNFLTGINPKQDYNILSPRERGLSPSTSAPQMRWLTSVL